MSLMYDPGFAWDRGTGFSEKDSEESTEYSYEENGDGGVVGHGSCLPISAAALTMARRVAEGGSESTSP